LNREFISYPKSGRTWIRYVLNILDYDVGIRFHHDTFEFNDGLRPQPQLDFITRFKYVQRVEKTVYLTRDPRDILVSLFFQITGRFKDFFKYQGSISDFIRDDYFGAKNLKIFREQWEIICSKGLALKVNYEDCHKDFEKVILSILTYYGFEHDKETVRNVIFNATFDKMHELERSGKFQHPWLRPRNEAFKTRKGKIGGYLDHLSSEDILYLEKIFNL